MNNRDSLVVPFFLENELINSGVQYFAKDEWKAHVLYSGEFFRTVFSQKIDVKLSKILSILTLPKYTSAGVL
ncbi:hypothetical protein fh0823_00110 [Francisella halioticida]|nr:hypothetical protein fh0823_00110 [Francisella halioticida]